MNKTSTIYGPPGTGKTRTLSEIAAEEAGIVSRVAFLSYTRAAAKEAAGRTDSDIIDTRTLHSMAYAALGVNRASIVNRSKLMEFSRVTGIPFQGAEGDTDEEQQDGVPPGPPPPPPPPEPRQLEEAPAEGSSKK